MSPRAKKVVKTSSGIAFVALPVACHYAVTYYPKQSFVVWQCLAGALVALVLFVAGYCLASDFTD